MVNMGGRGTRGSLSDGCGSSPVAGGTASCDGGGGSVDDMGFLELLGATVMLTNATAMSESWIVVASSHIHLMVGCRLPSVRLSIVPEL